jgi:hypothetical protein
MPPVVMTGTAAGWGNFVLQVAPVPVLMASIVRAQANGRLVIRARAAMVGLAIPKVRIAQKAVLVPALVATHVVEELGPRAMVAPPARGQAWKPSH